MEKTIAHDRHLAKDLPVAPALLCGIALVVADGNNGFIYGMTGVSRSARHLH
jgi:hypothetical protein